MAGGAPVTIRGRLAVPGPGTGAGTTPGDAAARAAVVVLAILFGLNWPAVRIALTEIPPWTLRATGLALAALALFIIALARGRSLAIPRAKWVPLALAGLLNIAGFNVLSAFAQLNTATSRAAIVTFTMPLWAAVFARLFLGEVPDRLQRLGLIMGAIGLGILITPLVLSGMITIGVAFALGAAISWAAGTVYLKRARIEAAPLTLAAWQLVVGALAAAAGMLLFEGLPRFWPLGTAAGLALAYHVLLAQALAYFLWFEVVGRLPAGTAALGTLGIPVVGVLGAMLILGERPTPADLAGFALILAAAATVLLPRKKA